MLRSLKTSSLLRILPHIRSIKPVTQHVRSYPAQEKPETTSFNMILTQTREKASDEKKWEILFNSYKKKLDSSSILPSQNTFEILFGAAFLNVSQKVGVQRSIKAIKYLIACSHVHDALEGFTAKSKEASASGCCGGMSDEACSIVTGFNSLLIIINNQLKNKNASVDDSMENVYAVLKEIEALQDEGTVQPNPDTSQILNEIFQYFPSTK